MPIPGRVLVTLAPLLLVLTACGPPAPAPTADASRLSHAGPDGDPGWSVSPPRAASTAAGALVVWSQRPAGGAATVLALPVGSDGRPVGDRARVSEPGEDADAPAVASSPDARSVAVTWTSRRRDRSVVRVRVLSPGGRPRAGAVTVSPSPAATPDVVAVGEGWVVAWRGAVRGEREIWWRRLDAHGTPLAPARRASHAGGDGDAGTGASFPSLAAGPLGVFAAWRPEGAPAADDELEVYGRTIPDGAVVRLSFTGADGDVRFAVGPPDVAAAADGFLVAWSGDTTVVGEREIWLARLAGDGTPVAAPERVTTVGTPGNTEASALGPALACGPPGCLVAWWGDPEQPPLEPDENEVFARRVAPLPSPPVRLSSAGPDGEYLFAALDPAVAAGPGGWLVTWKADDDALPLANDEFEVYARAVSG
ncbi:MAG: hypothetical protein ACM33B_00355 [Pseudomonadota bacterium]